MTVLQPPTTLPLTIAINTAISGAFLMDDFIGGFVLIPAAWDAANIGFQICSTETGTYVIAKDKDGSPIQIASVTTNASYWYAIPTTLFPARWVKVWSKSATAATVTDVNQTAARTLEVMLK